MARSIDPQPKAARGFIPARTDEERYLMRHIEDLAHTAFSRDIARYSAFLSDREQDLARAALGRAGVQEGFRFEGGWLNAERRVLCIEPEYSCGEAPICCVRLQCRAQAGAALPAHKDYLGSLMGLELRREALGDIVLPEDQPGTAYVFALEPAAQLICRELFQAPAHPYTRRLLDSEPSGKPVPLPVDAPILLQARDLNVAFPIRKGILRRVVDHNRVVNHLTFTLRAGETLGLVGESGSGKAPPGWRCCG